MASRNADGVDYSEVERAVVELASSRDGDYWKKSWPLIEMIPEARTHIERIARKHSSQLVRLEARIVIARADKAEEWKELQYLAWTAFERMWEKRAASGEELPIGVSVDTDGAIYVRDMTGRLPSPTVIAESQSVPRRSEELSSPLAMLVMAELVLASGHWKDSHFVEPRLGVGQFDLVVQLLASWDADDSLTALFIEKLREESVPEAIVGRVNNRGKCLPYASYAYMLGYFERNRIAEAVPAIIGFHGHVRECRAVDVGWSNTCHALAKVGSQEAIQAIMDFSRSENKRERGTAARALGLLDTDVAGGRLRALKDEDADADVRRSAIRALEERRQRQQNEAPGAQSGIIHLVLGLACLSLAAVATVIFLKRLGHKKAK